jgi:hypothetical protein
MKKPFLPILLGEAAAVLVFWICQVISRSGEFVDRGAEACGLSSKVGWAIVGGVSVLLAIATGCLVSLPLLRRARRANAPTDQPRAPADRTRGLAEVWWFLILTPCAVAIILPGLLLDFYLLPNSSAGPFKRREFEAIVEQVRQQKGDPTTEQRYRFGGRDVWARTTSEAKLKVVIVTAGGGHGGAWGYAYSDVPLEPYEEFEGTLQFDLPGPLREADPGAKIDDHWWRVYDDLN